MLEKRIIPCLLLSDGVLVKTQQFKKPTYIGDPINTVRIFNECEVDELVFLDINASKTNSEPDFNLLENIANECFMPLAYGGGIKSIETAKRIFKIGFEKIVLNYSLIQNINLITEFIDVFGSQSIVAAVDIKKTFFSGDKVFNHVTKKATKIDPLNYIKELDNLKIGEIFVTRVENEGMFTGLDQQLIKTVSNLVSVPIIGHGGANSLKNIQETLNETATSAIAAGSLFVYQNENRAVLVNYPTEKERKQRKT